MTEYRVQYRLKHDQGPWWYVQGVVRTAEGRAIRWGAMTSHCMKSDAERMYNEMYKRWNNDPVFTCYTSGQMWRGKVLP